MVKDLFEDHESDEGVEEAWAIEVQRRMASYRAGNVQTVGWSELRESLHHLR